MGNKISFSKFYTQFNVLNSYCFHAFDDATDLALNCLHYQPVQFFQKSLSRLCFNSIFLDSRGAVCLQFDQGFALAGGLIAWSIFHSLFNWVTKQKLLYNAANQTSSSV